MRQHLIATLLFGAAFLSPADPAQAAQQRERWHLLIAHTDGRIGDMIMVGEAACRDAAADLRKAPDITYAVCFPLGDE